MSIGPKSARVKQLVLKGYHPVSIMAECGIDSRQLAIALAAFARVKVPAYRLPKSGVGVRHYLPVFHRLGHLGLPRMRQASQ